MSDNDDVKGRSDDDVKVATVETDGFPVLAPAQDLVPVAEIDVAVVTRALRDLQQRMPDLVQLTTRERQSLANVANLDSAVIDRGLDLGAAWPDMKDVLGSSAEDVRAEIDQVSRNEELRRVLLAFADTLGATNLALKHRIGTTILQTYAIVGTALRNPEPDAYTHLRPYHEEMKRTIRRVRTKSRKRVQGDEPEE